MRPYKECILVDTAERTDARRRGWLPEALVLAGLALAVSVVFADSSLDVAAARLFYRPGYANAWPLALRLPWSALYAAAPWITASLVSVALLMLGAGWVRARPEWRTHGVFLLLTITVGPGLLVNFALKDHWSRPRPRDIIQFAGPLQYVPAPLPGRESGASFPCGHCSVGFLYGAGWWLWRRRRPLWARASLVLGLVAGGALGLGRMAAGAHFLSDVLWSALLAYGVSHLLYYHVLRLEPTESAARRSGTRGQPLVLLAAVLAAVVTLLALFAGAHGTRIDREIALPTSGWTAGVFDFEARAAEVQIVLVDRDASRVSVAGELHGFGTPGSRLRASYEFSPGPPATLRYRLEESGRFTDLDGSASVVLPAARFDRVRVRLGRGDIVVRDETRAGAVSNRAVLLDLRTASGRTTVQGTAAPRPIP